MTGAIHPFFDFALHSDIPLPELPPGSRQWGPAGWSLRLRTERPLYPREPDWYELCAGDGGALSVEYGRLGDRYAVRFPGIAAFLVDLRQNSIWGRAEAGVPWETLRHLLLDLVLPAAVGQSGRAVLHASAVRLGERAAVFVGPSGFGKSTLAASFGREGICLADDSVLLAIDGRGAARAIPSYPGLRLWPRSLRGLFRESPPAQTVVHYSRKLRLSGAGPGAPAEGLPLAGIFLLNDPGQQPAARINLGQLSGKEAIMLLLRRCFLLEAGDAAVAASLLRQLGEVLQSGVPLARLAYPRRHGDLPAVRDAVREIAGSGSAGRIDTRCRTE